MFDVGFGDEETGEPVPAPLPNDLPKGEYDFFAGTCADEAWPLLLGCV